MLESGDLVDLVASNNYGGLTDVRENQRCLEVFGRDLYGKKFY